MASSKYTNVTIVGAGVIGLSFAALHLNLNPKVHVTVFDVRPDIESYISSNLPGYLSDSGPGSKEERLGRIKVSNSLKEAVANADIVQEQGPEKVEWKQSTWVEVEKSAPSHALFWSSTSGITATVQTEKMKDKTRLIIVHPYNPPHIMPLLEVVPTPQSQESVVADTLAYWRDLGRTPVLIKKECTGFVANRLACALFREAISLVHDDIIGVKDLDDLVTASMGPRWAVAGPFKSYHAGGGAGGLQGILDNIGGTVTACWEASEKVKVGPGGVMETGWDKKISQDAEKEYGRVDTALSGKRTVRVLEAARSS